MINIIGVSGLEGSGKDAVCKYIQRTRKNYWYIEKFASCVKQELQQMYPNEWNTNKWENGDRSYRNEYIEKFDKTRRDLIRYYSESMKDIHGNDYWAKRLFEKIENQNLSNVLISDVRFFEEIEYIKNNNGIVIRIDFVCNECGLTNSHSIDCNKYSTEHISETQLLQYDNFDHRIINNKTLFDLYDNIDKILKLYNV